MKKPEADLINPDEEILPPPRTRTVLIEDIPSLRKLLGLNLEIYTGTELIYKYNADDITDFLKQDQNIDLIICKEKVGDENTILKVFYYVNSQKLKIPILLLGKNPKLEGEVTMVDEHEWKKIIKTSASLLKITAAQMVMKEVPDHYPVSIRLLSLMTKTPVTIYQQGDDGFYTTLYAVGAEIDKKNVNEMILDGHEFIYVNKNERLKLTDSFSEQVESIVTKELSADDRVGATGDSFKYAQDLINKSGLTEAAVKMAQTTITSMNELVKGSAGLADLLDILKNSEDSYLYRHSMMIALIAHHTVSKMEWSSTELKDKICFVAFFHDITIPKDELCIIQSNKQLEAAKLDNNIKKKVLNHAFDASQLLKDFPQVPFGAESFILQHHGMQNGIGFPKEQQDPRLSPLAIIFKIVEEYVEDIIHPNGEEFKRSNTLDRLKSKYTFAQYKKVVLALEEATK